MGTFPADLMAQGAIWSPTDIDVKTRKVAAHLSLHDKMDVPVKAIQMVNVPLQQLWSMWPDDRSVIHITEPIKQFMGHLC